jgi:lipid-A-disaccharide synthase
VVAWRVMMIAVEASADAVGASLAGALRLRLEGDLELVGIGGPRLAAEGLHSLFDPSALAVVGAFNALGAYPEVLRRARQVAGLGRRGKAGRGLDGAVLIDAWGFNLRVARRLRRIDPAVPLIKYVAPQVWATRPGRARTLAGAVDYLLTIHSFDAPLFEREGLATRFVGNPALSLDLSGAEPARARAILGARPDDPILLLLPGSRAGEVRRLAPAFEDAVRRLAARRPNLRIALAVADSVADQVRAMVAGWPAPPTLIAGEVGRLDVMRAATVALACSGTVTTHLALAGCPMVVAYRLDPATHLLAKALIRTPYITLFNVAAGDFVAPERVQHDCTGEILARDLARLLDDPELRRRQVTAQYAALETMRGGIDDPIAAAADAVADILRNGRNSLNVTG